MLQNQYAVSLTTKQRKPEQVMDITLRTFGITREITGGSTIVLSLPEHTNVEWLLSILKRHYPQLSVLSSLAIAINGQYASNDSVISSGDEVALIPPVSGG
jgi:molybdopterin synthase sulfur carrier subunit